MSENEKNVDVAGPMDMEASLALLRADASLRDRARAALAHAATPAVVDEVRAGRRRLGFTFAGQGAAWFDEIAELHAHGGAPRHFIERMRDVLVDELATLRPAELALLPDGIDALAWLDANHERPDASSLAKAALSSPWIVVAQMARVEQLRALGFDEMLGKHFAELPPSSLFASGHSQGSLGALAFAATAGKASLHERIDVIAKVVRSALHLGVAMQSLRVTAAPPSLAKASLDDTGMAPTPMAALSGATLDEVRALIETSGAEVVVAVENAPMHHTLAGAPAELEKLRRFALAQVAERRAKKAKGQAPGRVVEPKLNWLDVSGPFHTSMYLELCDRLTRAIAARADELELPAGALALPVLDGAALVVDDGHVLARAVEGILTKPSSWRGAVAALVERGADLFVDCGPGVDVAHLAGSASRGRGVAVLACSDAKDRRALLDGKESPRLPSPWSWFAPRAVVDDKGGERLVNKYVEATGCPPIIVPGMTPTTVEAPIVVAAANAGFVAELAGGGQVTAPILRARLEEIRGTLTPGRGVVFNALYLDPYLWGLHFAKDRAVIQLRDEGYPIAGVTISAGIPPVDDAVSLLDDLVKHGMTLNAFKPGNDRQLDEVIAIAKARPQMTICAHIEGGKAGGHHSWEDLDDLLLRHYAKLRAVDNLVICVGGGIGNEEQASSYLFGTWSEKYGMTTMPVDAVFLGTRLMATKEARTSASVKQALVAAAGDVSTWPTQADGAKAGAVAGGVVSGKSSLDAPIYYLDNAAAKCGRLLDEVAGDAAKVSARRDEIVSALNATAKPYFGDVDAMTPKQLLARMTELLAPSMSIGGEPGTPEPSWLARLDEMRSRIAARYGVGAPLDDGLVHPEDARFFLEVCKRPGKPVPFVPVVDADVRRWFKSDSLWQSHDDRFPADAVLAIPGPAAVASIKKVDEPVADVLASFVTHAQVRARELGRQRRDDRELIVGAHAPEKSVDFDLVAVARNMQVAVDGEGRWHKNPLRDLPERCVRVDENGRLRAVVELAGGASLDLCVSLAPKDGVDVANGAYLEWDREKYLEAQHAFYSTAMFGSVVEAVALFSEASEPVCIDRARVEAFRAATGDDGVDDDRVPLAMAFPAAWPAIFRALAGAKPDVVRLVHESETSSWSSPTARVAIGDVLTAKARVQSVEDVDGGRRVVVEAKLVRVEGEIELAVASTVSRFFIRASVAATARSLRQDRAIEAQVVVADGELAFLRSLPFVKLVDELKAPCTLALKARATDKGAAGTLRAVSNGVVCEVVGTIEVTADHGGARALEALLDVVGAAEAQPVALTAPRPLGQKNAKAPAAMHAYADASGDKNPLHVDDAVARLAGFAKPIVHGMWTSSLAVHRIARLAADGDASRLSSIESKFTAPVLPKTKLVVEVSAIAKKAGATVVRADVKDDNGVVVVQTTAEVAPPKTAYVFPGQGVQHAGMGMDAYARSKAARAVWDEADAVCRAHHGFSLLDVVRDNPRELYVRGERLVHPEGVLFLTQLTQVALAVMAVADVAELRERGLFVDGAAFAGHSLGEYSALAAVPAVMPLAGVVDIVYERGRTMDRLVARDASGRSPYAMGALRPNLAGLDETSALAIVDEIAKETGLPLFVVNHNVRGRQYAVTGDVRALAALKKRLNVMSASLGQKNAFVDVPGIDVPFHSPLLRNGVDAFRARLEAVLPARIDASLLEGRYVPNLTGTTFALDRAFLDEALAASGSPRIADWIERGDVTSLQDLESRDAFARSLLVEVLAYQFASPVRWIAVQDVLSSCASMFVEVGPAKQPVLVGMAKAGALPVSAIHAALDVDALISPSVVETDPEPTRAAVPASGGALPSADVVARSSAAPASGAQSTLASAQASAPPATVAPAQLGAPLQPSTTSTELPEPKAWAEDALVTLLCVATKKSRADIDVSRSLDHVLGGNSARRNQVLADVAAELGARAVDNAHEMPLASLASMITKSSSASSPGPVLKPLIEQAAHKLAGVDVAKLDDAIAKEYALSPAHRERIKTRLLLRARADGAASMTAANLVDALVADYGRELGVSIAKPSAKSGGAAVDSAALDELEERILGARGVLAKTVAALRAEIEPDFVEGVVVTKPAQVDPAVERAKAEPEHDEAYFKAVAPIFDAKRMVSFTSSWAWARRDLLDERASHEQVARRLDQSARAIAEHMLDEAKRNHDEARVYRLASILDVADRLAVAVPGTLAFRGRTALVTGAGEGSIARSVVSRLLEGGARVIVASSRTTPEAASSLKSLYQTHAALGAELHVIPCNQGSFADVDALAKFLAAAQKERVGSVEKTRAPMIPDLLVPFGAISETADATSMGPRSLAMFRVLVLGVERLVARIAELHKATSSTKRVQVVLPLSPNHGTFGGDGAYGECKAALEALLEKQRSERHSWGDFASVIGARIGWVRGTGLMHKNDGAARFLEERGLKTFSTDEMADALVSLMHVDVAARAPFVEDITGGLGEVADLASLLGEHRANEERRARRERRVTELRAAFAKLTGRGLDAPALTGVTSSRDATALEGRHAPQKPAPHLARERLHVPTPSEADLAKLPPLDHLDLDEVVVVVGYGEVSPWGSARTRWSIEKDAKLSIEAALELAWMTGLIKPDEKGAGFVDAKSNEKVRDDEVHAKYERAILEHAGVRVIEPAVVGFDPRKVARLIEVRLDRDFRFPVPTREAADAMVADDPEHTIVVENDGALFVVRKQGGVVRVPAALGVHRAVAGQLPTGWDATRFGVPKELAAQVDPVTLYCLVATADAFLTAGLGPDELFAHLHPGRAGVTIGTGIGGMTKLKKLYRDFYDGADRQNDALQETLINVIGGYVVQSFLGSYGPMSFPVGACATAGLSMSEAVDKIKTGAADLVVAGGADDLSEAGNIGFGDMGATADTDDLASRGVQPKHMSRPNDARRRGFVESQGCGVVVVARASLAVRMGLPVYSVVAYAGSSGDGLQKSVPAPGQGALAMAAEDRADPVDSTACDLALRRRAIRDLEKKRDDLAKLVGAAQAESMMKAERRRIAHDFARDRSDISPLRASLAVLGLVADDVGVVSKHDSSTQANDLNEAKLHETLATTLGRSAHKPLFVISQKALTGHPKGAAAAWQMNGLMQAMADGVVPGNFSLDDVDDDMKSFARLVWSDRATELPWTSMKAGLVTTLGFGHVSALVCLAHPFLFWRALDDDTRRVYAAKLEGRRRRAEQRLQRVVHGREMMFVPRERPAHLTPQSEAKLLVDASARLTSAQPTSNA